MSASTVTTCHAIWQKPPNGCVGRLKPGMLLANRAMVIFCCLVKESAKIRSKRFSGSEKRLIKEVQTENTVSVCATLMDSEPTETMMRLGSGFKWPPGRIFLMPNIVFDCFFSRSIQS